MELQGERTIKADRATVWQALNDPDVLRACVPGCEELERTSPTTFEGQVTQKVGPVKAKFRGTVTLSNVVEGQSYTIVGEGKGGAAGFVKGGADVTLTETDERLTHLAFDASWKVGGKLAQLGNRLIDGFARKTADEFFDRFRAEVENIGSDSDVTAPVDEVPDQVVDTLAGPSEAVWETTEEKLSEHPMEAPGAAGPPLRGETITGESVETEGSPIGEPVDPVEPRQTRAKPGPAGGTDDAPFQVSMSKLAADVAARQDDPDAEPESLEDDPAVGPPDAPERGGTDGVMGGAGTDPARIADAGASDETPPPGAAPEGPKKAAPELDAPEQERKESWFKRVFRR